MKVLLTTLNSKFIHSNLALKYLYAVCVETRDCLELREFSINNEDDYIYSELIRGEYDIVCFSCYIWNIEKTLLLIEHLKKARSNITIVLGGPEVSHQALDLLKRNKGIDFILTGEGEENFPKLLVALIKDKNSTYRGIRGLLYRYEGKIYVNPSAYPVDFQQIPFPYSCLVCEVDKIIYYESSRGCPNACSYCLSASERGVRSLPLERVKQDLSYFIYKNVKQVKLVDRTFNYDKGRALEIFKYLINLDNGLTNFHFEICGDLFDQEVLDILKTARPGLFQFEIGIQSTNEKTLNEINRSTDFSKLEYNVRSIKATGNIHLHLDLIAGLPFEDYNSFKRSFNEAYSLKPHKLQLGFLKLLKGAPIEDQIDEHGYIFRSNAPYEVISNKYISAEELIHLKMIERVFNLYYNRGGFYSTLEFIVELKNNPFEFYEEFAFFYYLKGFQHRSYKKEDQYRILHLYGRWKEKFIPGTGDYMDELIEQDMALALNPEAIKKFKRKGWELEV